MRAELGTGQLKAAFQKVKHHVLAGVVLSVALGVATYAFERREIMAEVARDSARQIGEIEARIGLAQAEIESTQALISQASPRIDTLKDFIGRLALSKTRNVPWVWAPMTKESDVVLLETEVRAQHPEVEFKVQRSSASGPVLAPVVMAVDVADPSVLGRDMLAYSDLARLVAAAQSGIDTAASEPLIVIGDGVFPADTVYMARVVFPAPVAASGRQSLILRGITHANLVRAASLKNGQMLKLVDKSSDPPRALLVGTGNAASASWQPEAEFTVGRHLLAASLSVPGDTPKPVWWFLATLAGLLLTGFFASLRSGFIVGERATQLGSMLTSTEQELAETQRREIAFFENAGTANCETDFGTGQLLRVNDSLCRMFGYAREELLGKRFSDITHPDDIALSQKALRDDTGSPRSNLQFEKRYLKKDGTSMWGLVNAKLYHDASGKPRSYMTVIVNIDDRKRDEATKALLTRELAHRVRNTVQLTSSLARQTAATARSVGDYDSKFHRRRAALSAAQDILFDRNWMSAPLPVIAQATIKPFLPGDHKHGQMTVRLPDVELPTQQAQTIAIALHELASNSSRHGALAHGGTVSVAGTLQDAGEDGSRVLHLSWDEHSPKPVRKPRRSGFGTRMLLTAMPEQFGGTAKATWRRTGLLYEAWLNLPKI